MPIESWARGHWEEGGGDAFVAFWVFGEMTGELQLSREKHRVTGLPVTVQVSKLDRGTPEGDEVFAAFTDPALTPMGQYLDRDPDLADAVRGARSVFRIAGEIPDPDDLLYLRNVIGLVEAILEAGGIAVADMAMHWWSADGWRSEIFAPDVPPITRLVSVLGSPEDDGTLWLHTRGMRLFGRPDPSVRGITPALQAPAEDLVKRLVNMQALGGIVPDGQPVKMQGIPPGWTCRHGGDVEDPDFDNVHLAIGPADR